MMCKMNLKQNQNQSQKLNNIKRGFYLLVGCIGLSFSMASTLEFTIQPKASYFFFSLPANPTTGYQWFIQSYDKSKLAFHHSEYKASTPGLIGSGGVERFYFYVTDKTSPLDTYLVLKYARPWEKENSKPQNVHLTVKK